MSRRNKLVRGNSTAQPHDDVDDAPGGAGIEINHPGFGLRLSSLLVLGVGMGAFAPAAWAAACAPGDTAACSAPGGIQSSLRGGYGGAGNGQGGGSTTVVGSTPENIQGTQSSGGQGGMGASGFNSDGPGGAGGNVGATTITDGTATTGAIGTTAPSSASNYAGGGGGGGDGLYSTQSSANISASTSFTGGQGGAGGSINTNPSAMAGGGGGGGAGAVFAGANGTIGISGQVTGGKGGAGGNAYAGGAYAGGGGGGGDGILMIGTGTLQTAVGATITGGLGGHAGTNGTAAGDGISGAGVNLAGNSQTFINQGTTTGGASAGPNGAAGPAVASYGDGNIIHNALFGNLSGGMQADGVTHGLAIDIEGNSNSVILEPFSNVSGDMLSNGDDNRLTLNPGASLHSNVTGFSVINSPGGAGAELSGALTMTRSLQIGVDGQLLLSGTVSGAQILSKTGVGQLVLTGANTYSATGLAQGTIIVAGDGTLGGGSLTMAANTTLDISQSNAGLTLSGLVDVGGGTTIKLGNRRLTLGTAGDATFNGIITDGDIGLAGGNVAISGAGGSMTFKGANTYTGGTTINSGTLLLAGNGSLNPAGAVTIGASGTFDISGISAAGTVIGDLSGNGGVYLGAKSLTLGTTNDAIFGGTILGFGGGLVKQGSGALVVTSINTSISLQGGSLYVGDGPGPAQIEGAVQTSAGTTLGGYGVINGTVNVAAGGHLAPGSSAGIGTLFVANDMTLAQGSQLDFEFGAPGTAVGSFGLSDHVVVTGTLTLNGAALNVIDAGGLGPGVYNLFRYSGLLNESNGGITLGSVPSGASVTVETLALDQQINLISASQSQPLHFWNANGLANAGRRGGGSGTWSTTSPNWTDATGTTTGAMAPQPGFAIFGGAPGTVTVDDGAGAVQATGIQFASDGYSITGGALTLVDPAHNPVEIRVGDGSAASTGWTASIDSVVAGSDGLAKTGAGTLVLAGANTYMGGTSIQAGILSVDSDTRLGNAAGAITLDGGTLRVTGTAFNHTARAITLGNSGGGFDIADAGNTFMLDQALSGSGGLNKLGAGTLLITANNTYTGTTTISGGTLQLGNGGTTGSITGDIANNGTLVFNRSDDVTFGNAMSGSGNLLQSGPGSLTLTGDSSAFAGASNVAAGALIVNGKLGGTLSVASGATLAGTGTVGDTSLAGGSILAPGNSSSPIGTLTVNGNLAFAPGSAYQVQADPAGTASDSVHVTGVANLAGSVIHVGPDGNFTPSQTYTILTADGGVNGAFDSVTTGFTFLTPTLTYDPNDAFLTLKRNKVTFASLAKTGNQRAVAGALDNMLASAALPIAVSTVTAAQAPGTFDALSGEIHPSTTSVLQSISQNVASMPLDHLRNSLSVGAVNGPATAQLGSGDFSSLPSSAAQPVWAQVFGNWRTLGGNSNTGEVKESDGGLFVGADRAVGAGWRLGGAFGYTGSHSSLHDRSSTSNVDSYSASIYGGKAFQAGPGTINLMVGTAYTWNDIHTKRNVGVAGLDQTLKANYGASTAQLFSELGYALPLSDNFTLEPFAGAAWSDLRTRGFSESGGSAALNGKSNSNNVTTTTLGLHARTAFAIQETQGHLNATVGWRHAFGDVQPQTTMAFDGSQAFTVAGAPLARDAAVVQLGADVAVTRNTTVGIAYSGQYGAGNQQNSGSVNVNWRF
jgi:outer membrane autotransporter protein